MKQNYLNVKFVTMLLEEAIRALNAQEPLIRERIVSKWGCVNDFIYSEILQGYFLHLLPCEREALMRIIREVINASTKAYSELLEDDYLGYESIDKQKESLDDFIEQLENDNQAL